MVGANPLVSHGWVLTAPRIREQLQRDRRARRARGRGRPAPLRDARASSSTSPITPGQRRLAAALAAARDLRGGPRGRAPPRRSTPTGCGGLRARRRASTRPRPPRSRTGVPPQTRRARSRATSRGADGAAAYGRTGSCLGRFGTLVAFLLDALNAVTGNLDRPGRRGVRPPARSRSTRSASRSAWPPTARRARASATSPTCSATCPPRSCPRRSTTPGERQMRALLRVGRQPRAVGARRRRAGGGARQARPARLARLLRQRDQPPRRLRAAGTTFLERDDVPLAFLGFYTTPFVQYTDAVVEPRGEAREEWEVDRRDLAPDRHRSAQRPALRRARRRLGRAAHARSGSSTCCCAPGPTATGSACGAAA